MDVGVGDEIGYLLLAVGQEVIILVLVGRASDVGLHLVGVHLLVLLQDLETDHVVEDSLDGLAGVELLLDRGVAAHRDVQGIILDLSLLGDRGQVVTEGIAEASDTRDVDLEDLRTDTTDLTTLGLGLVGEQSLVIADLLDHSTIENLDQGLKLSFHVLGIGLGPGADHVVVLVISREFVHDVAEATGKIVDEEPDLLPSLDRAVVVGIQERAVGEPSTGTSTTVELHDVEILVLGGLDLDVVPTIEVVEVLVVALQPVAVDKVKVVGGTDLIGHDASFPDGLAGIDPGLGRRLDVFRDLLEPLLDVGDGTLGVRELLSAGSDLQVTDAKLDVEIELQDVTFLLAVDRDHGIDTSDVVGDHTHEGTRSRIPVGAGLQTIPHAIDLAFQDVLGGLDRVLEVVLGSDLEELENATALGVELVDVRPIHRELNLQSIVLIRGHLAHLDDRGSAFLSDERAVDLLLALEVRRDAEVLDVGEGALGTETQSTDEQVAVILGAAEVGGVQVVDVVFGEADAEIPDAEPGFHGSGEMDDERFALVPGHDVGIPGIAGELTDHRRDLVTVETIGKDPEALHVGVDLEAASLILGNYRNGTCLLLGSELHRFLFGDQPP